MAKRRTAKRTEHKIIRGLEQAIEHAKNNGGPQPMVFEHVEKPQSEYDRISERVMVAVSEINAALQEAHECAEMRVFLAAKPRNTDHAMQFQPQIYRLTHSTMAFTVKYQEKPESKSEWRVVKDPAFEDAAGIGLSAFQKKPSAAARAV